MEFTPDWAPIYNMATVEEIDEQQRGLFEEFFSQKHQYGEEPDNDDDKCYDGQP